jgi:hypothetical protein
MVSNTRRYGALIAFASGFYSLWSASMASRMVTSGWLMALLGVVVIVHGTVLLTGYAERLGDASGPLMIGYSLLMLLNQALLAAGLLADGSGMGGGMDGEMGGSMGGSAMTSAMGWDAGMVALAVLMLASGVIMTQNTTDTDTGGM